jgi:phage/plasmid primase-like uncharacterized protein
VDLKSFSEKLAKTGFTCAASFDGSFQRFDRSGTLSGWYIGREYRVGDKTILYASYGDWRSSEKYEWSSLEGEDLPEEEKASLLAEIAKKKGEEKEARRQEQERVANECEILWNLATDLGKSPYLEKKGLTGLHGCKLFMGKVFGPGVHTLVPARDIDGNLWGVQRINAEGGKYFTTGMRIKGCFHALGGETDGSEEPGIIYIAEGIATAASIELATGKPTVAAFNAGNLEPVSRALRDRFPHARLVVCGDEDKWTRRPDGTPYNPGRDYATRAAKATGAWLCFPRFANDSSHPTDFNDLMALGGLDVVKEQLAKAGVPSDEAAPRTSDPGPCTVPAESEGAGAGGILRTDFPPMAWKDVKGKKYPPTDQQVADTLLRHYGGHLVKQERDLFVFLGTHWKHLSLHELDLIHQQIQALYSYKAGASKLKGIFDLFMTFVDPAPVDMFLPRATTANFLNGTLHAVRGQDYKYTLSFQEHRADDYLISVIPLRYEPEKGERNPEFESMLERVFSDDADRVEKIRAVRQMYGACLMPLFPHLFLLHGPQGSGKSSLIIPAQRLVHRDNWCSVEPHEFKGFLMETLVGKLVNIVTDINTNRPMDDANLKKIEDRVPVRIDRKFQKAVYAPLPAIHILGANDIPPTLDGGSGAHTRRWTFLEVSKYRATDGAYRKDFANWVFDQSPAGVLNFALEGLADLCHADGHFVNPASGKERLAEWQREHDLVGAFLHDLERGEIDGQSRLFRAPEAKIRSSQLYEFFRGWSTQVGNFPTYPSRNKFRTALKNRGFLIKVVNGIEHFSGIGFSEGTGSGSGGKPVVG